jgi:hypothetical protein
VALRASSSDWPSSSVTEPSIEPFAHAHLD